MSRTRQKNKVNRLSMLADLCERAGFRRKVPGKQYLTKEELASIVCLVSQLETPVRSCS